jgi:hypothetical protein
VASPAKWLRLHRVIPLIHRQFRVSYLIQTRNSRLTQTDDVLGASPIPPTPHQAPGLSAYQRPQPQMLGPLLCDGNARPTNTAMFVKGDEELTMN